MEYDLWDFCGSYRRGRIWVFCDLWSGFMDGCLFLLVDMGVVWVIFGEGIFYRLMVIFLCDWVKVFWFVYVDCFVIF